MASFGGISDHVSEKEVIASLSPEQRKKNVLKTRNELTKN